MVHAKGLLSLEIGQQHRCTMFDIFLEMDRVLRPEVFNSPGFIFNVCIKFLCEIPMSSSALFTYEIPLSLVYFLVDYWIMHFSFLCANRTYFLFNHFYFIINSLELGFPFNLQYWLKGPLKIPGSFNRMPGKQQQEQQLIAAMGVSRLKVSTKRSFVHCWSRLLFSLSYYFIGMGTGEMFT